MHDVPDFVADDGHQFVVVHQIHQSGEDADRTVAAGKGVDVGHQVDLEIQRKPVGVGDTFGEPLEARTIGRRIGGHGIVGVHPFDRFAAQPGDLLVVERDGLGHVLSGVEQLPGVYFLTADFELSENPRGAGCGQECRRKQKEKFLHIVSCFQRGQRYGKNSFFRSEKTPVYRDRLSYEGVHESHAARCRGASGLYVGSPSVGIKGRLAGRCKKRRSCERRFLLLFPRCGNAISYIP